MTWQATVLTIFPEMFPGPLGSSLAGKALGELPVGQRSDALIGDQLGGGED